jgi:sugar/nucleoside kinase (ribokinase family)
MADVLAVGQLVADVVVPQVTRLPRDGEAIWVEPLLFTAGGGALNAATVLDRLGVSVGLCGLVGHDRAGRMVLDALSATRIDAAGVRQTDRAATSASVVLVSPDGQRSFYHHPGATSLLSPDDIPADRLASARVVLLPAITKLKGFDLAAFLRRMRQAGKRVVVDVDYDPVTPWPQLLAEILPFVDVFVPSADEAAAITGQTDPAGMARRFRNLGAGWVGIKRGAHGCFLDTGNAAVTVPACRVPVVDTTGAGDAWVGGLVAGYLWGWEPGRVARLANACGAMAVTAPGATEGVGDLAQAERLMREVP